MPTAISAWQGRLGTARAALLTTDGRWAMVSTGITTSVAVIIAALAMGTLPMTNPAVSTTRIPLTYELFLRLLKTSSSVPLWTAPDQADRANPDPGVETRTVTLDSGDTLAGALEDVGISRQDANSAVAALMNKDFSPRSLRAGLSIEITYAVATIDATGTKPDATAKPRTTIVMVNDKPVEVPLAEDIEPDATPGTSEPIQRLLACSSRPRSSRTLRSPAPRPAPSMPPSSRRS